tara:strand:+ start:12797 stop:13102 length:306 start_codon:yes stop_codon:yes gene_type:complete
MAENDARANFPRNRPESGPMIFGDDWRGLFIRGDNALGFIVDLETILMLDKDKLSEHSRKIIENMIWDFRRSNHHTPDRVQMMKPFKECFIKDEGEMPDFP